MTAVNCLARTLFSLFIFGVVSKRSGAARCDELESSRSIAVDTFLQNDVLKHVIKPTGASSHSGGLASTRCQAAHQSIADTKALPIIATARGQDPAKVPQRYRLPQTRVYLCHDPPQGAPAGFLYLNDEEFTISDGSVIWSELLPNLLDYTGYHGNVKSSCENPLEYLWVVDENLNVILAPQWEKKSDKDQLLGEPEKHKILSSLTAAASRGEDVPVQLLEKIRNTEDSKDLEGLVKKCHGSNEDFTCTSGSAGECQRCVGDFLLGRLTESWFVETKHGDLLPGDSPTEASGELVPVQPLNNAARMQSAAATQFAASFGGPKSGSDVIVAGDFRGPARLGGEVYGCPAPGSNTPPSWTINDMSGYSLNRVPLEEMGEVFQSMNHYDLDRLKDEFKNLAAKKNPSNEVTMQQMCVAAHLMGLPPHSTQIRIANKDELDVSQCPK